MFEKLTNEEIDIAFPEILNELIYLELEKEVLNRIFEGFVCFRDHRGCQQIFSGGRLQ